MHKRGIEAIDLIALPGNYPHAHHRTMHRSQRISGQRDEGNVLTLLSQMIAISHVHRLSVLPFPAETGSSRGGAALATPSHRERPSERWHCCRG